MPPTNHFANGEVPLAHRVPRLEPVEELGGLPGPERLGIGVGLVVDRGGPRTCAGHELGRRRERPSFDEQGLDRLGHARSSLQRATAGRSGYPASVSPLATQDEHPVGAEAAGIGERGRLDAPAATGERGRGRRALRPPATSRRPRPRARRCRGGPSTRAAACTRGSGRPTRSAIRRRYSSGRSQVMSWVPGVVERIAAALVRAVRAHPRLLAARRERRRGVDVVEQHDLAASAAVALDPLEPARGPPSGTGMPRADVDDRTFGHQVGLGDERRAAPGPATSTKRSSSASTRTSSQPSALRSTTWTGRLSNSSLASTTPRDAHARKVVERGDDRAAPGHGLGRLALVRPGTDRAPRRAVRARAARVAPRASSPTARPARSAAPPSTRRLRAQRRRPPDGPGPRRLPPPRTDRARPAGATRRRARGAITMPNSDPTSGLVTKSRPARPAPPPRVKKPSVGLVQRGFHEVGERDRPFAVDALADARLEAHGVSPTRKARSPMRANSCGYTPTTTTTTVVSASAATRATGSSGRHGVAEVDRLAEPHLAHDGRVVEERDHREHRREHPEDHRRRRARGEHRPEHHELGEPARERRDRRRARTRRSRTPPRGRGSSCPSPANDVISAEWVRRAFAITHGERAEVHRGVDEDVDDHPFEAGASPRRGRPATASGTRMKPPCAIDE